MPKRQKKTMLALPAQAKQDVKTVTGILDRWAVGVEDIIKDVFEWAKKHKVLVLVVVGLIAAKRYWLDEQPDETQDEDF
jgi:hypothetical protein